MDHVTLQDVVEVTLIEPCVTLGGVERGRMRRSDDTTSI
jgi:hypothetical protein